MDKYIGLGVACAALLSLSTAKADIIIHPNDQHVQVGASNPRDIDVQYKQKHHRVDDIDTDPKDDLSKVFEVWSADPMMADVDVTNDGPIDDRRPIDPPGVSEPRSAALLLGALVGFFLIRRRERAI